MDPDYVAEDCPETTTIITNYTTPTQGPCQYPQWFGDGYCDDGNNNAACGWDGGDCCGDDVKTNYCTVCECLDPDFEGGDCVELDEVRCVVCDYALQAWHEGDCESCDFAETESMEDCKDTWSSKKCKKSKKKCDKDDNVAMNCKLTCDKCDDDGDDGGDEECKDIWSAKKCNKMKKNCEKKQTVADNCKKTCDKCGPATTTTPTPTTTAPCADMDEVRCKVCYTGMMAYYEADCDSCYEDESGKLFFRNYMNIGQFGIDIIIFLFSQDARQVLHLQIKTVFFK